MHTNNNIYTFSISIWDEFRIPLHDQVVLPDVCNFPIGKSFNLCRTDLITKENLWHVNVNDKLEKSA